MFSVVFLTSFLVGNYIAFLLILKWLKVTTSVSKRALFLSLSFLVVQVIAGLIEHYSGLVEPTGAVLSIIIFGFILRRVLILKLWQIILIPIGVSVFSYVVLALFLMLSISLFGSISID